MRRLLTALLLAVSALLPAAARPRVVSINMCTDQLLLALADPDQILGLSYLAREPSLSWFWRKADGFRSLSGTAEDVLPLRPDLVFSATVLKAPTRAMLRATGVRVEEFASPRTIAEVLTQIERAGALLDQPTRAAAAIARIEAARQRLSRQRLTGPALSVLPLERRGWVSGAESLVTDLLATAGLINLGASLTPDGSRFSLEWLVTLKPDRLLLAERTPRADDQGLAFLRHPALAAWMRPDRTLILPDALTVCGGTMIAEALDRLADEIERSSAAALSR